MVSTRGLTSCAIAQWEEPRGGHAPEPGYSERGNSVGFWRTASTRHAGAEHRLQQPTPDHRLG